MWTNPVFILAVIALVLAVIGYWHPTIQVAVILLAVAVLLLVAKPH